MGNVLQNQLPGLIFSQNNVLFVTVLGAAIYFGNQYMEHQQELEKQKLDNLQKIDLAKLEHNKQLELDKRNLENSLVIKLAEIEKDKEVAKFEHDKQLELDKQNLENLLVIKLAELEKDEEVAKFELKKQLEQESLNLKYRLQLSQGERNFHMITETIVTICRDYTEPKEKTHKNWFRSSTDWDRAESGMEDCVSFMHEYLGSLQGLRSDKYEHPQDIDFEDDDL